MFLDDVVIAGLITVGGTVVFLCAIGVFVYQDMQRKKQKQQQQG
ncbi:MAG TPA: cytochrome c oxidase subunit CcoM [Dongiaceae bacterium]|nr:cytochrome c oxidase subunit CcoM [Dongiaceae bacterium]